MWGDRSDDDSSKFSGHAGRVGSGGGEGRVIVLMVVVGKVKNIIRCKI